MRGFPTAASRWMPRRGHRGAAIMATSVAFAWSIAIRSRRSEARLRRRLAAIETGMSALATSRQRPQAPPDVELPVGAKFPANRLRSGWWGSILPTDQAVLLVHWDPRSPYCRAIDHELKSALARSNSPSLAFVLPDIDRDIVESLRTSWLGVPVLLDGQPPLFLHRPTPSAYLLAADQRVLSPMAVGPREVMTLATIKSSDSGRRRINARPLVQSRVDRGGLRKGDRAPDFTLPDTTGGVVTTSSLRGRRVLLLFTNPECAPCAMLGERWRTVAKADGTLPFELLVVGRGDPTANRNHVASWGVDLQLCVQDRIEVSRLYRSYSTPAAFVIEPDGLIGSEMATGVSPIIDLALSLNTALVKEDHHAQA